MDFVSNEVGNECLAFLDRFFGKVVWLVFCLFLPRIR